MKLLLIAPMFYGYEGLIKRELENRYEKVWFKNELPFNVAMFYYAIKRLNKRIAKILLDRYNNHLVKFVSMHKVDCIFIIRGCGIYEQTLMKLTKNCPNIEIVNYQWDSIQNNPNGEVISRYASRNYSFDIADTLKYPQFTHVPLFHCWSDEQLVKFAQTENEEKDIDMLFVGGYHSGRHIVIKKATADIADEGLKMWSHIFVPRLSYLRDRLTKKVLDTSSITTHKLSKNEYFELLCRSNSMLDIQSPTQTGATMRSVETLAAGRKLVSTNKMLKNEKFFSAANIRIWNMEDKLYLSKVLNNRFDHSKDSNIYSLKKWIEALNL